MDLPIITILASCLVRSMDRSSFVKLCDDTSAPERIQRMTLAAIFDFVCDSGELNKGGTPLNNPLIDLCAL